MAALLGCGACGDDDAGALGATSGETSASTSVASESTGSPPTGGTTTTTGTTGTTADPASTGEEAMTSTATSTSTVGPETSESSTTSTDACANGSLDPAEADVDCGGSCAPCPTGSMCELPADCATRDCETGTCLGPVDGCDLDAVQGSPGGISWADSYSVDGRCYCASTFDHAIGEVMVDTPAGPRTVLEVCEAIGPGPGIEGNPVYNDIQCGNGPANDAGDEDWCPGRVDQGEMGCCTAGPEWDLSAFE